jgi:hypothetical protein
VKRLPLGVSLQTKICNGYEKLLGSIIGKIMNKYVNVIISIAIISLTACNPLTKKTVATQTATIKTTQTQVTTSIPTIDIYDGWKTFDSGAYTFLYPESFYIPTPIGPVFTLTDSKETYETWAGNTNTGEKLFMTFMSLNLDRRLDPINNPDLLASPDIAMQKEINMYFGVPELVNNSTNVPWENANGGTSDGKKWFIPNIPFQDIMLGATKAEKVINARENAYFILFPKDNSYYVRFSIKPANASMLMMAEQILLSFKFSN